jgi:hypothetical protein
MHHAFLVAIIGRQGHSLDEHSSPAQQIVNVPVLAATDLDMAKDPGVQPTGGTAGIDVATAWEAEAAEPADRDAQVNWQPQPELIDSVIRPAVERWHEGKRR